MMARGERVNRAMGAGTMAPSRASRRAPIAAAVVTMQSVASPLNQATHHWHTGGTHRRAIAVSRSRRSARGTASLGCPRRTNQCSPGEQARRVPWLWQWAQCPYHEQFGCTMTIWYPDAHPMLSTNPIPCSLVSQIPSRWAPRGEPTASQRAIYRYCGAIRYHDRRAGSQPR